MVQATWGLAGDAIFRAADRSLVNVARTFFSGAVT